MIEALLALLPAGLQQFHFLRPMWLLMLPVALLLCIWLAREQAASNNWKKLIDADLLAHLLQGRTTERQRLPLYGLCLSLLLACLALAGPSWEKLPLPIHKNENALVILLDMSPSMLAEDLQPSRLVRARLKLTDLLQQRREGLTALVAYAGDAHTVTPLTDDTETIISLLPALSPTLMPLAGSNTEMALEQALKLFRDAGILDGDILLVTDGVADTAADYLANHLPTNLQLSVLGVGTEAGAPIPVGSGGFARDNNGAIVLARLETDRLKALAQRCRGIYRSISTSDSDLLALQKKPELSDKTRQLQREFDTWQDRGTWLCLLLLPAMLLAFRRGWVLCLLPMLMLPRESHAFGWQDLWYTDDQQAQQLMQEQQHSAAEERFERRDWKASAAYRAGNYERAAELFGGLDDAQADYNRGNALARAGRLQEALEAYDSALQRDPNLEDASANRDLVESLLNQQKQQQQQNQNQQDQQGQNSQQQEPGDGQRQDSGQNSGSQARAADTEVEPEQKQAAQSSQKGQNKQDDSDAESGQQEAKTSEEQNSNPGNDTQAARDASEIREKESDSQVVAQESDLSPEEQQAMDQWLRKIPDDPGGLMRRKFQYQHRQRLRQHRQGDLRPPGNNADNRW